ncbi:4-oxalocrotonate tautomerase [Lactobacillus sp. CC-MHH1034]|nr:4-oxalocrotonate tautomerase [Agrilactobacillus fermenti]
MPLIHVDLLEGRSKEQLKNLVKEMTAVVEKNTGAPAEHIHIVLNEMQHDHYAVGGILDSDKNK